MPKFKVTIARTVTAHKIITLDVADESLVQDAALEQAGNLEFPSGHEAEYAVMGWTRLGKKTRSERRRFLVKADFLAENKCYATETYKVEADNRVEANRRAYQLAKESKYADPRIDYLVTCVVIQELVSLVGRIQRAEKEN